MELVPNFRRVQRRLRNILKNGSTVGFGSRNRSAIAEIALKKLDHKFISFTIVDAEDR